MLDTRMPPTSSRTRRSSSSARPERLPAQSRFGSPARTTDEPVRRPLPSAQANRLSRSEMRLMGIATACTVAVCALLLLYLAAYAQVTQLGIAQAEARTALRRAALRRQLLEAECNTLQSPQRVTAAAIAEGMTPRGRTPVDYVSAHSLETHALSEAHTQDSAQDTAQDYAQGNSTGGTTEDSRTAASFRH